MKTHYELLDIAPKAGDETETAFNKRLRTAYLQAIRSHHPDRSDGSLASDINAAYTTLHNATQRSLYDQELPLKQAIAHSNRRALNLASSFNNCFDWIACICQTVQAVRPYTRSVLSFGASDRMISRIFEQSTKQDAAALQTQLMEFIESDTHWESTSARTLFFDLMIMRRTFADANKRQEEAIRTISALCTQAFDQPPTTTTTATPADSDAIQLLRNQIKQQLNQSTQTILSIQTQIDFIREHLNDDQQASCGYLLKLRTQLKQLSKRHDQQTAEHRRFAAAIVALGSDNPQAVALILTLEQITLRRLSSSDCELATTQTTVDRLTTDLKKKAPFCLLFAQPVADAATAEPPASSTARRLSMSSID